jgi:hydroxyacylglutathione hydrolase
MIFEQVLNRDLGCAAYVVGCQQSGEAVVVDPPLHVAPVLEACAREGARLVGVIETHTHADHVSGHGVLASQHGCWIAIHESAGVDYPNRPLRDGERVLVGNIALDVLHAPGHRPEHCVVAVSDLTRVDEPWLLLTGDSLFVGEVARPDLAIAGEEGAAALYVSLHERLRDLTDAVEIYPGHVAGSLCGKGMSSKSSTTLGFERRFNPMLADMPVDEFVRRANSDLAPKPPNLGRIVALNRGPLIAAEPVLREVDRLADARQTLDVRPAREFAAGHAPGSLNVPLDESGFATRAGFALDPELEVVVIARDDADAKDARRRLAAAGFLSLARLRGGIAGVPAPLAGFEPIDLESLRELADAGELQVLDVREPSEQTVLARGAVAIPYRVLRDADLSALDPTRPVGVVCQTGSRSPLAASLLAARGFALVRPVLGEGMASWRATVAA